MAGRNLDKNHFIQKFGREEGERRYLECVSLRDNRKRRIASGNYIKLGDDLEAEIKRGNAIKCKACGKITTRLQWTHFKNKCSIKSIEQYQRMHPGAPIVAPNLAKKTTLTLDNFIKNYGETDGKKRWDIYCNKQAISNSYEYKIEKFGWTREEFDLFNASRAITAENMNARYGEETGPVLWQAYCERQRFTNSLEYFIEREGNKQEGIQAWLEYNEQKGSSRRIPDIAERFNISYDEAAIILSQRSNNKLYTSQAERSFVDNLEKELNSFIKYSYKTRQFCLWSPAENQPFFYDVCCTNRKKIIEFHGDYWHANPKNYSKDFVNHITGKTVSEIWYHDEVKEKTAIARGFGVMVVWENELNLDKTISEVIQWFNS